MPTYSTNEDLAVYIDAASLPETTARQHEAAYTQIRQDLRAPGWTVEQLDALTAESLEALKAPSCHYVLYLIFQSPTHARSPELLELAKLHLGEYQRTLRAAPIESTVADTDASGAPSSGGGYVVLG